LESINLETKKKQEASYERSDVCAVPAASVIIENVVAFEMACALVDKFGGDSVPEMKARYELFLRMAREQ
jgi:chorismate synthase